MFFLVDSLAEDLVDIFQVSMENCFMAVPASTADRRSFFYSVLMEQPLLEPPKIPSPANSKRKTNTIFFLCFFKLINFYYYFCLETVHEPLPLAPPPLPRELSEVETNKLIKQREAVLRELRVFLRETTNRLLAERKFKEFTKPVSPDEVLVWSIYCFHDYIYMYCTFTCII